MVIQIQVRRDTAANWTSNNPVLAEGEWGYETDTKKFKIGDGTTHWGSLAYIEATGDVLGPATSEDNTIARFDGADTKTIQASLVTIDDSGSINIPSGQTFKINGSAHTHSYQPVIATARKFFSILQALIPATNGVTIDQYETATNKIAQDYALFASGVTKYLQWKIGLDNWNTTTLKFEPVYDSASANSGNVIFTADAIRLPDGGTIDTAWGTAISSTDTYQGSGKQHIGPQSTDLTPAGASGDEVVLRITRGADSLSGDVRLTGIWIEYPVTRV